MPKDLPSSPEGIRKYIRECLSSHSAMGTDATRGCEWAFELTEPVRVHFDRPREDGPPQAWNVVYMQDCVFCHNPKYDTGNESDFKCFGFDKCGIKDEPAE